MTRSSHSDFFDDSYTSESGRLGIHRQLLIFEWLRSDQPDLLDEAAFRIPSLRERYGPKLCALHWLPASASLGLPTEPVRQRIRAYSADSNAFFEFSAVCLEHDGMLGSAIRSIITATTVLHAPGPKVRVFRHIEDAIDFLRSNVSSLSELSRQQLV